MLVTLHLTSFNQSRNPPMLSSAEKSCYLEALTHSSLNHGVEGAAEKGRPDWRGEMTVLFASDVRLAAVLPKSINCKKRRRRAEDSGEQNKRGELFSFWPRGNIPYVWVFSLSHSTRQKIATNFSVTVYHRSVYRWWRCIRWWRR